MCRKRKGKPQLNLFAMENCEEKKQEIMSWLIRKTKIMHEGKRKYSTQPLFSRKLWREKTRNPVLAHHLLLWRILNTCCTVRKRLCKLTLTIISEWNEEKTVFDKFVPTGFYILLKNNNNLQYEPAFMLYFWTFYALFFVQLFFYRLYRF